MGWGEPHTPPGDGARYGYCRACGLAVADVEVILGATHHYLIGDTEVVHTEPDRVGRMRPCGHRSGSADLPGLADLTPRERVAAISAAIAAMDLGG